MAARLDGFITRKDGRVDWADKFYVALELYRTFLAGMTLTRRSRSRHYR